MEQMNKIREAVLTYYDALTARKNGESAGYRLLEAVQEAMGMHWEHGVDHRAAAPQVVADERAAFEGAVSKLDRVEHLEQYTERTAAHNNEQFPAPQFEAVSPGDYRLSSVQFGWLMWQARAALAAAPVQAQEPVEYALTPAEIVTIDDEVLKKGMRGADGKRQGYCVLFAQAVIAANNAKRTPVQPVAVPDGWRIVEKATNYALISGNTVVASLAGPEAKENAAILARVLASPAAQGYTKALAALVDELPTLIGEKESKRYGKEFTNGFNRAIRECRAAIAAKAAS